MARNIFVDLNLIDLLSKPSNGQFWTRSPFPTWEFGFVGAYVFGQSGNTMICLSRRYRNRPWLMAIEVLCCWLTNHVGAANEISAMHRNAARFYCGVFNDRICRGQTDGRVCIRHLHRYRLICLHGAEMRAEVLRENSRGVFGQTVGIVTLRTGSKAIV